jgi:hypothetical protein
MSQEYKQFKFNAVPVDESVVYDPQRYPSIKLHVFLQPRWSARMPGRTELQWSIRDVTKASSCCFVTSRPTRHRMNLIIIIIIIIIIIKHFCWRTEWT